MSAMPLIASRPLLDLLGGRWKVGAPVSSVAWDRAGALVCFGLGDGSLAIAGAGWEGAPSLRPRPGGGVELVQATARPPALARVLVHRGACLSVAADPDGGFLSGGDDGQLARVQADGTIETLARSPGAWMAPVACGPGGWRVYATGKAVHRLAAVPRTIVLPARCEALAVAPDGARIAIGHAGGVTLWAGGVAPRTFAAAGAPHLLAWSMDARWLAAAAADAADIWNVAAGGTPIAVGGGERIRAIGFAAHGGTLVAAVGTRVASWRLAEASAPGEAVVFGVGSREAVTRLACHPQCPLVAVGYRHGAVLLCQPGSDEVLIVRAPGDGAVSALVWSGDGDQLAIGTEGGDVGIVASPNELFRGADTPQP
jgi:hypothetical protein